MLLERYNIPPLIDQPESANEGRFSLQLRVLEIFASWLGEHRLLEEEPHIAGRLTELLNGVNDPRLTATAESLHQMIERLVIIHLRFKGSFCLFSFMSRHLLHLESWQQLGLPRKQGSPRHTEMSYQKWIQLISRSS